MKNKNSLGTIGGVFTYLQIIVYFMARIVCEVTNSYPILISLQVRIYIKMYISVFQNAILFVF